MSRKVNGWIDDFQLLICFQANAFVQREIFQEFNLDEEEFSFNIPLPPVLECLNLFGTPAAAMSSMTTTSATTTIGGKPTVVLGLNIRVKKFTTSMLMHKIKFLHKQISTILNLINVDGAWQIKYFVLL